MAAKSPKNLQQIFPQNGRRLNLCICRIVHHRLNYLLIIVQKSMVKTTTKQPQNVPVCRRKNVKRIFGSGDEAAFGLRYPPIENFLTNKHNSSCQKRDSTTFSVLQT